MSLKTPKCNCNGGGTIENAPKLTGCFQEDSALVIKFFQTFYSPGNVVFSETVTVSAYLQHWTIAKTVY